MRAGRADTAACSIADDGRVQCTATLPLWHAPGATEDDVEARFAAITAAWRRAGLVGEDRALGTEIWGRGPHCPGPAGVLVARLRGTTDGITLTAESPPAR